jgi:hypothetical protein
VRTRIGEDVEIDDVAYKVRAVIWGVEGKRCDVTVRLH